MMKTPHIRLFVCTLVLGTAAAAQNTRGEYIEKYRALAIEARDEYGIPASITMAQALFESDNGNSRLAREANNHFGIKCKSGWQGGTISHDDDARGECFRSYASTEESYRDHSLFLTSSPRYASLFKLKITDYQGWAHGLKAAGYATNPRYAEHLIKVIEDNSLYLLDDGRDSDELLAQGRQPEKAPEQREPWVARPDAVDVDNYVAFISPRGGMSVYRNNGSEFVIAAAGETFESLARKVGAGARTLRRYNDLPEGAALAEGEMVYIKRKASRASNGKLVHVAERGETMRSIAQKYGIRLRRLAAMNRRGEDAAVVPGQQLRLR